MWEKGDEESRIGTAMQEAVMCRQSSLLTVRMEASTTPPAPRSARVLLLQKATNENKLEMLALFATLPPLAKVSQGFFAVIFVTDGIC